MLAGATIYFNLVSKRNSNDENCSQDDSLLNANQNKSEKDAKKDTDVVIKPKVLKSDDFPQQS